MPFSRYSEISAPVAAHDCGNTEEAYRKDTRSVREEVEKRMGQKLSKAMRKACNHLVQSAFKAQKAMEVCSPIM